MSYVLIGKNYDEDSKEFYGVEMLQFSEEPIKVDKELKQKYHYFDKLVVYKKVEED